MPRSKVAAGGVDGGRLAHLLHEPLLHFLLIGARLFSGYTSVDRGRDEKASPNEIRLPLDELAQLEFLFEAKWKRPPTAGVFNALLRNRIHGEILVLEALALGLDKDDTIVRRRMAQTMKFLAEGMAAAPEPTPEELQTWFEAHGDLFALPPRACFRHLYFSAGRPAKQAPKDAGLGPGELTNEPL